jgi:hypothetical protein
MSGCETVSPIELLKHKKINRRQNMWSVWVTATSNRAVIQGAVVKSNVQMTTCPRRGWADCGQPMSKRHGLSSICPCPPAGPALSTLRATQLPGSSIRLPLEEHELSLAAEQYLTRGTKISATAGLQPRPHNTERACRSAPQRCGSRRPVWRSSAACC